MRPGGVALLVLLLLGAVLLSLLVLRPPLLRLVVLFPLAPATGIVTKNASCCSAALKPWSLCLVLSPISSMGWVRRGRIVVLVQWPVRTACTVRPSKDVF